MLNLLRQYWPAILLSLALLLVLDGTISSLLTCHPPLNGASHSYNSNEHCTVFQGPLFSLIVFLSEFFEAHDKGIVAAFTVMLAVSTILLWDATKNLWIEAQAQREENKIASGQQFEIARQSIQLAKDEFSATHRPEIVVHAIEFRRMPGPDEYDLIGASILCFNKGRTSAEIVEARCEILSVAELNVDVMRRLVASFPEIASGMKLRFNVQSEWQIRELALRTRQNLPPFRCVGTVSYLDRNKTRRETGFCFVLKMVAGGERWVSAGSPEHEYAF
jgi:hypothetical protein